MTSSSVGSKEQVSENWRVAYRSGLVLVWALTVFFSVPLWIFLALGAVLVLMAIARVFEESEQR